MNKQKTIDKVIIISIFLLFCFGSGCIISLNKTEYHCKQCEVKK